MDWTGLIMLIGLFLVRFCRVILCFDSVWWTKLVTRQFLTRDGRFG